MGQNHETTNEAERRPLHLVGDVSMALFLIERGALIDLKDDCGKTPLRRLIKAPNLDSQQQGTYVRRPNKTSNLDSQQQRAIVRLLVSERADVEEVFHMTGSGRRGRKTTLHYISVSDLGHDLERDFLHSLLGLGAEIDTRDYYGRTPLHYAVLTDALENDNSRQPMSKSIMFLEAGADASAVDGSWTLLHLATFYGDKELMKFLVEHGADELARNEKGLTAREMLEEELERTRQPKV